MSYILAFNISSFLIYLREKTTYKFIRKNLYILSALILIILVGFRYYVGTDYGSYIYIYNRISYMDLYSLVTFRETEIGHNILCKIISMLGFDYKTMFIVYGFLTTYFIYKSMKKLDVNNFFFILAYACMIYPYSFNIMRQVLAMAIVLYSFTFLVQNNKKMAIIYLILASLFHLPSLVVLPLYIYYLFIKNRKARNYLIIITYILIILLFTFNLTDILSIDSISRYSSYSNSNGFDISFLIGTIMKKIPILLLVIEYYKKIKKEDKNASIYVTIFVIGLIMSLLGGINSTLNRVSLYFSIFDIILIGKLTNRKKMNVFKLCLYVYLIFFFFFQFYHNNIGEIFPYRTWL